MSNIKLSVTDDRVLREEIYMLDIEGPVGLKKRCFEKYLVKVCSSTPVLFVLVRKERVLDDIVGIKVTVFGTQTDLDSLRVSLQPQPNFPLTWKVIPRYETSVSDCNMSMPSQCSSKIFSACYFKTFMTIQSFMHRI